MRRGSIAFLWLFCVGVASVFSSEGAHAQFMTLPNSASIALKAGESLEIAEVYWVVNCRSVLKSTPEVEILDGPPGVTASIKDTMVLPRRQNCAKRVPGGMLVLSAKEIEDPSYTRLTLRFTFRTRDGDRKSSDVLNLSLLP
jgi:hypothetical protein